MVKKWDIILIAALLILSWLPEGIAFWTGANIVQGGTVAVVQVHGTVYKEIPLSEHQGRDTFTIHTDEGDNTVVVQDQTIGIVEADCPDKICIQEGFIRNPGETTVCLPHKVMVEIRSTATGEPDIIPAH